MLILIIIIIIIIIFLILLSVFLFMVLIVFGLFIFGRFVIRFPSVLPLVMLILIIIIIIVIIITSLVNIEVSKIIRIFLVCNESNIITEGLLLQKLFRQILQISFGEIYADCTRNF